MTRPNRRPIMLALATLCLVAAMLVLWLGAATPRLPDLLFGAWRLRHVLLAGLLLMLAAGLLAAWLGRNAALIFWSTTLSALLLLVLLEGAGRAGLINWSGAQAPEGEAAPGWTRTPDMAIQGDTYQDIATLFGVPHDPIPFSYTTDPFGFRNEPGALASADILLLGDSIVLGAQVPRDRTIDSVVEATTGRPTAQAALLGLSIQEQHDMLREAGMPVRGKQVVQLLFEGNDLLDSRAYRATDGDRPRDDPAPGGSFIKRLWEPLVRLSNPPARYSGCRIDGQDYLFLWTRKSFVGAMDELTPITEAILTFKAEVEALGGRYALAFVPTKYRVLHPHCTFPTGSQIATPAEQLSDLPDTLAGWAREHDLAYLDLTDALTDAATQGRYSWFWGDTHWNEEGHETAGEGLARWLTENEM